MRPAGEDDVELSGVPDLPAERTLPGAISGFVRDAGGRPLAGATVLAASADGADAAETYQADGVPSRAANDAVEVSDRDVDLEVRQEPVIASAASPSF